MKMKTMIG